MTLSRSAAFALVCAAFAGVATAQSPIRPDARGYQTTLLLQQMRRQQPSPVVAAPAPRAVAATYSAVNVTVQAPSRAARSQVTPAAPAEADATTIAIRGPDGEVRRFPLEGGPSSIVVRQYMITPGQAVTVQVTPTR